MAVRVHAGVIPGFLHIAAELGMDRAGMAVLVLFGKVGNHFAHDIQQIMLQVLQVERIDVVGALLNHDGTRGVV